MQNVSQSSDTHQSASKMMWLWITLGVLTIIRLFAAGLGHLNEAEAYMVLCSQRLAWGFVEGPAGLPALLKCSVSLGGETPLGVRLAAPLAMGVATIALWRMARSLRNAETASWAALVFNLLPLANSASLVMEGTMVIATCWIITVERGWAILATHEGRGNLRRWILLGVVLAVATQFTYAIGWLLPAVVFCELLSVRKLRTPLGIFIAALFLLAGWIGPLIWNARHDWIQWSALNWGAFWAWQWPPFSILVLSPLLAISPMVVAFLIIGPGDFFHGPHNKRDNPLFFILAAVPLFFWLGAIGHHHGGLAELLAVAGLFLPSAVAFSLRSTRRRQMGAIAMITAAFFSAGVLAGLLPLVAGPTASAEVAGVRGVVGIRNVSVELLRLRTIRKDATGQAPFLIAQTPGLAALVGASVPIVYPEISGAPSVFVPESPSLTSQFNLWPSYADAVAAIAPDALYTEEKSVSPFLGRNAVYLTTESPEELPQTIRGAFSSVAPLGEMVIRRNGQPIRLRFYQCETYQTLPL